MRVIVAVGGDCEEHEGQPCVMAVIGPFGPDTDPREYQLRDAIRAAGFVPHWMSVMPPEDWLDDEPGH